DRGNARSPGGAPGEARCAAGAGSERRGRGVRRPGGAWLPAGGGGALAQSGRSRYTFDSGTDPPRPAGRGAGVDVVPMTAERIISGTAAADEEAVERAIRPRRLEEYVGQLPVKTQLEIFIRAAGQRGEALDHVLIFGPPGL